LIPWEPRHVTGTVGTLHERSTALVTGADVPPPFTGTALSTGRDWSSGAAILSRTVTFHDPVGSALVLGSGQTGAAVDLDACAAAGVDVVRRSSGGGAVLVDPGSVLWVDFVVPAGDPLWTADVGRAAWWVGEAWSKALGQVGVSGLDVWKGPMQKNAWSSRVCFAGLAAGEVTTGPQSKVVGISQRRTRRGALFQCACLLTWEPAETLNLLALSKDERTTGAHELAQVAAGVGVRLAPRIAARLLTVLP
jgi:lipoate---protein ligase